MILKKKPSLKVATPMQTSTLEVFFYLRSIFNKVEIWYWGIICVDDSH